MSKYLARLKSEKQLPHELPKLPKGGCDSFDSSTSSHFPQNTTPRHRPDRPAGYLDRLADEAERRADFCQLHRQMIGGTCERFDVLERLSPGDQAATLDACLLWRLVMAGAKVEQAAPAEITGGVTVGDVLAWVGNNEDIDAIRKERRLVLTCADSMGTIH